MKAAAKRALLGNPCLFLVAAVFLGSPSVLCCAQLHPIDEKPRGWEEKSALQAAGAGRGCCGGVKYSTTLRHHGAPSIASEAPGRARAPRGGSDLGFL